VIPVCITSKANAAHFSAAHFLPLSDPGRPAWRGSACFLCHVSRLLRAVDLGGSIWMAVQCVIRVVGRDPGLAAARIAVLRTLTS
jgi:hypothetical protein